MKITFKEVNSWTINAERSRTHGKLNISRFFYLEVFSSIKVIKHGAENNGTLYVLRFLLKTLDKRISTNPCSTSEMLTRFVSK